MSKEDRTPLTSVAIVDATTPLAALDAKVAILAFDADWEQLPAMTELTSRIQVPLAERLAMTLGQKRPASSLLVLPLGGTGGPDWVVCVALRSDLPAPYAHRLAGLEAATALAGADDIVVYASPKENGRELACRLVEGLAGSRPQPRSPSGGPVEQASAGTPGEADVTRALLIGDAISWCRELVNQPSSELTPARLAQLAAEMADSLGVWNRTWSARELKEGRFGGISAVSQGADNPACMTELRLGPGKGRPVVLVGKGVTCDTGGLQIKLEEHEWLKADMAGAAAVLAATWVVARLQLDIELRVLIPCVENMPGPGAYRTGDVIVHRDGSSTEIRHTDAEGRLILGDVIAFAREEQPAAIIDVATLTDEYALGPQLWPFLSNDDGLADALTAAGNDAGDPGWRLPLWPGYRSALASDRADRANIGLLGPVGAGGTVLAALFLSSFAGEVPWAHIDIAGTAYASTPRPPMPAGATGAGSAALVRLLESYRPAEPA